jgi:chemotaxis protein methyltransferase CheR
VRSRDELFDELARAAADEAGLELTSVRAAAIERFVERSLREGVELDALREQLRTRAPRLLEELLSAVLVGETFFFREPAHFRLVSDAARARLAAGSRTLSAWSAGCSSGEEAYSLAATLLAAAVEQIGADGPGRGGIVVDVLGTDLSARALARARGGTYGKWSQREAGPMLHPIGATTGDTLRVRDELRRIVRYERRNLLEPPPRPLGGFDIVMCRNVFTYLHAEAAGRVARHLRDALAPGGLLIVGTFGAIDDPSLVPVGGRELGAYLREATLPPVAARPAQVPARPEPAPSRPRTKTRNPRRSRQPTAEQLADHVQVHLQAIHLIEAQKLAEAEVLLGALIGRATYAPALLDLALISERRGRPGRAAELATRLLELMAGRDPDEDIAGPETLPVSYYTTSARTFLARLRGRA